VYSIIFGVQWGGSKFPNLSILKAESLRVALRLGVDGEDCSVDDPFSSLHL
jgi:hypothetical protein